MAISIEMNDERNLVIAINTFDHSQMRRLVARVGSNTLILGKRPLDYALHVKKL